MSTAELRDPNSFGVVVMAIATANVVEHVIRPARRVWRALAIVRGAAGLPVRPTRAGQQR